MVTLANFDGRTAVANIDPAINLLLQTFGTGPQRAEKAQAEKAAELKRIDTQDAIGFALSDEPEDRLKGFATLVELQGLKFANGIKAFVDSANEDQLKAFAVENEKVGRDAARILAEKDPVKQMKIINALAVGADPGRMRELLALSKMDPDAREISLGTDVISSLAAKDLTAFKLGSLAPKEVGGFEQIKDTEGNVIAQKNLATGELKSSPLAGGSGGASRFSKSPPVIVNNPDGTQSLTTQVLDKSTGKTTIESNVIGGQLVSRVGETPEQLTARKIEEAGGAELAKQNAQIKTAAQLAQEKSRSKAKEERLQDGINDGLSSAALIPALKRNLELFKTIDTGGFAAAQLKIKQQLGIETADEAELANALKKNVLSQLRETFGAAFTEREGALLADIEAGFGKSTAGNIRLMRRSLKILNDRVKRGRRDARNANDKSALEDMDDLLKLDLKVDTQDTPATKGINFSTMSDKEFLKGLK